MYIEQPLQELVYKYVFFITFKFQVVSVTLMGFFYL